MIVVCVCAPNAI